MATRIPYNQIQGFMQVLHQQYKVMASFQDHVEKEESWT